MNVEKSSASPSSGPSAPPAPLSAIHRRARSWQTQVHVPNATIHLKSRAPTMQPSSVVVSVSCSTVAKTAGNAAARTRPTVVASPTKAGAPTARHAAQAQATSGPTQPARIARSFMMRRSSRGRRASTSGGTSACAVWLSGSAKKAKSTKKLSKTWYAASAAVPKDAAVTCIAAKPRSRASTIAESGPA